MVGNILLKACLCITPGHLSLHVQHVWNADMPWQLLLSLELLGCLLKAKHCLVDEIACYCLQLDASLPKATTNQVLPASILQFH